MKVAFITGVTGYYGSYLSEFLIEKRYMAHAIKRRSSSLNTERIDYIYQDNNDEKSRFKLYYGDLTDSFSSQYIAK